MTAMDRGVGRILATLDELRIRDNTIVMFLSDNGASAERMGGSSSGSAVSVGRKPMRAGNFWRIDPGPSDTFSSYGRAWANTSNTPFSQYKHLTSEGGLATPFLVSWPGRLPPGRIDHRLLHVSDLMPTVVELCDAQYPSSRNGTRIGRRPDGSTGSTRATAPPATAGGSSSRSTPSDGSSTTCFTTGPSRTIWPPGIPTWSAG